MTRRFVICSLLCAITFTSAAVSAQVRDARTTAASTSAAPAPTGTAAISGVVMSADASPRPLRLATVVLIGAFTGVLKVTSTDRDGKFTFTSLPADRYNVGASKAPFLGAVAGARRPARPGTPLVLADGQKVNDIVVRLPPAAAISGQITDELGRPASALVSVQQRKMQNGERVLISTGNTVATDELGRYRVFGLAPGEYVLSAYRTAFATGSPRQLTDREFDDAMRGVVPPPDPVTAPTRYVPTFYPGTSRPGDAGGILLAAGDERAGVDVRLQFGVMGKIEGTLSTSDGQLPPTSNLMMMSVAGGIFQSSAVSIARPNGGFTFANVMPGTYVLTANQSGPGGGLFASQVVEVSGDQSDVQLVLRPPLTLKGRLTFDGASALPALNGWQPSLKPMSKALGSGGVTVASDTAGAFSIQRLPPGTYIVNGPPSFGANANSVTWSLKSVVADGKDITDLPIDLTAETLPKDIVLTFSDKWQSVAGKLQQSNGAPATDYSVIVFPSDKAYWQTGSRRILVGKPDSSGQFTLGGPGIISLPAGEYLLAAVTELDRDEQFDPALLASLVAAAVPLSIQPGERKVQDLVIR